MRCHSLSRGEFFLKTALCVLVVAGAQAMGLPELPVRGAWGGAVRAVSFAPEWPDLAFVCRGGHLAIVDVAVPSEPREIGAIDLETYVHAVKVRDGYAFAGGGSTGECGFQVVDVRDPRNPRLVWQNSPYGDAGYQIQLHGDMAYVYSVPDIGVFDIREPANPVFRDVVIQGWAGGEFDIADELLYVVNGKKELRIYDLSKPWLPYMKDGSRLHLVGKVGLPGNEAWGRDLAVMGNYAYVATWCCAQWNGVFAAVDVSDPAHPEVVSSRRDFFYIEDISAGNGLVCVADWAVAPSLPEIWQEARGLVIFDARQDPVGLPLAGTYKPHGAVSGVEIVGPRAYVMDEGEGLVILDISEPQTPRRLGNYHSPAQLCKLAKVGDLLFLTDRWNGVTILNVADARRPKLTGVYQTPLNGVHMDHFGIDVHDGLAYLGAGWTGLQILDVHDPVQPRLVGEYRFPAGWEAVGMKVDAGVAHVGGGHRSGPGVFVNFDVHDPHNIFEIGFVPSGAAPVTIDLAASGLAYLAEGWYRGGFAVAILDNSDPNHPTFVYEGWPAAHDITHAGNYLFAACEYFGKDSGLKVLDISDPRKPREVAHYPEGQELGVAVRDHLLYLSGSQVKGTRDSGLHLFDIRDLANPRLIAHTDFHSAGYLLVDDRYAYVTCDEQGLTILSRFPRGDLNCDGFVNESDTDAFVLALCNPDEYRRRYPNCDYTLADCNADGKVDNFDIDPFVKLLSK